jgi:hypothetical protein
MYVNWASMEHFDEECAMINYECEALENELKTKQHWSNFRFDKQEGDIKTAPPIDISKLLTFSDK